MSSLPRGGDAQHDLDAAHDVVQRHRRRAILACRLRRQIGQVQKAAAHSGQPRRGEVHQPIKDMVADKGAGHVRDDRRQPRFAQRQHRRLDRQGREIRGRPAGDDRRSIGCRSSLSAMRASSILIATRSSDSAARPPARPRHSTMSGPVVASASSSASRARPNTVGKTGSPDPISPSRDGSRRIASNEGLTGSLPNGSNPVTRAFIRVHDRFLR